MNENDAKRPILIVDDDKHFRYLVRESLEEGLKVSEAEDGYQSLKIIEQCIPQLINLFEDTIKSTIQLLFTFTALYKPQIENIF